MASAFERKMLGNRERQARREHALHDRIRRGVDEEDQIARLRALLQRVADRFGVGVRNSHRREDDLKCAIPHPCLGTDLGGQLEMRKAAHREDGQLLSAHQGGESIDRRDAGDDRIASAARELQG